MQKKQQYLITTITHWLSKNTQFLTSLNITLQLCYIPAIFVDVIYSSITKTRVSSPEWSFVWHRLYWKPYRVFTSGNKHVTYASRYGVTLFMHNPHYWRNNIPIIPFLLFVWGTTRYIFMSALPFGHVFLHYSNYVWNYVCL